MGGISDLRSSLPPVVVKTVPQSGDTGVDPSIAEIRVTFSKPMMDGSWSWTQISNDTFPKVAGKPRYIDDRKTCVLPVKLEPGRTYVSWLNSQRFGNLKDLQGHSAVPYLLVFETRSQSIYWCFVTSKDYRVAGAGVSVGERSPGVSGFALQPRPP